MKGVLSEDNEVPFELYNVELTVYDPSYCSNVAPSTVTNWDSQLCSGSFSGGKDTCLGIAYRLFLVRLF